MKKYSLLLVAILILPNVLVRAQSTYFSAISPSGHLLYYKVTGSNTVAVCNKASYDNFLNNNDYDAYYMNGDSLFVGNLIIPSSVDYNGVSYTVTSIIWGAFYHYTGITAVVMPNTINEIGAAVFNGCSGMTSISLSNCLTTIGGNSFEYCSSLLSITIPSTVTSIGDFAFDYCTGLNSICVQSGNTVYDSRNNCNALIKTATNELILGCKNSVIPPTVYEIGNYAFFGVLDLTAITIPNSVYSIGTQSFAGTGLSSITIPENVQNIGIAPFSGCNNLSSISVHPANLYFDSRNNCNAIIRTVDNNLMQGCKTSIIPPTVTRINNGAFYGCTGLQTISLPDSITSISDYAFDLCDNLNTITIPSGVVYIGSRALYSCDTIYMQPDSAPQIVGNMPFDTNVYISLPCGADDSYYDNSRGWQRYQSNIHEPTVQGINVTLTENHSSYGSTAIVQQRGNDIYCDSTCIISATPNDGYRFMHWSNGNTANPDTLHLVGDTSVTAIFSDVPDPELCMVSVEDGHNMLQWNDVGSCAAYRLYRESVVAGEYEAFAEISSDSGNVYIDSTSRPQTRSYRYRISAVDADGVEGYLSPVHKTMHLTISQGVGGRWNLQWTPYEGAEYSTYIIYRGTNAEDMEQIDIMPADGNTSYTDEESPSGDVYYQVGIVMSNPCSEAPSAVSAKSTSISRSNIATNSSVGINSNDYDGINVHSRDGHIIVDGTNGESIAVYDMFGRNVGDCSQAFPIGVYMVKIGNLSARKVVVIR